MVPNGPMQRQFGSAQSLKFSFFERLQGLLYIGGYVM